jgi:hypothetical protein
MASKNRIYKYKEPELQFSYKQNLTDPRDGLTIFGPYDRGRINDFSVGIIGTMDGIRRCKNYLLKINKPVYHVKPDIAYPFFPGFETVFGVKLNFNSVPEIPIEEKSIQLISRYNDNHIRVGELVDLYVDQIIHFNSVNEKRPNLWFIVIPDLIYQVSRPNSSVSGKDSISVGIPDAYTGLLFSDAKTERWQKSYFYENHFHNQLKIKLLKHTILTQIIKESTIAYEEIYPKKAEKLRISDTAKAWNISTTLYYKLGGLPWKLASIRDGVCYIGLTFKKDETQLSPKFACCAAQMFLDSGDGMVFRGRVGPYYNPLTEEYHLTKESAKEMLKQVIDAYKRSNKGDLPKQLFIHGKTLFEEDEWNGFLEAAKEEKESINLVGIRIGNEKDFKLFRSAGDFPILRGSAFIKKGNEAFLWTKGFIPRIQSVLGLETPNALNIRIVKGEADINDVCRDILSLTKLNYNACIFCDGQPVTLKFADTIGEILTAGPNENLSVLPFMYYI